MITVKKNYEIINDTIQLVKKQFGADSKLATMFENCISNTLNTTIKILDDGSVFVITGDIPAMWLRDSACQLRPFLFFAKEDPSIRELICGLIAKQMDCILIDPYANAFNESANGNCWEHDKTDMKPELWERKFEIDSLCFPIQLSYLLWKNTGVPAILLQNGWKQQKPFFLFSGQSRIMNTCLLTPLKEKIVFLQILFQEMEKVPW